MRYKTVIFDLDGTLLDTLQDLANGINAALAQNNMPQHDIEAVRMFVGNGAMKLVERATPAGTSEEVQKKVLADFNTYYKVHCADNTQPYPGVLKLLQELRTQGIKTAIVSNKPDYGVQELAKQYFPGLLDAACGARKGIEHKPAPDMLLAIMQELNADVATTIYVGDSDVDLQTAANCGIPCIGVCWGFRGREFLIKHGATLLAETTDEVKAMCQ